jgi:hypothetical protein
MIDLAWTRRKRDAILRDMLSRNSSEGDKKEEEAKGEVNASKEENGWNKDETAKELLERSYGENNIISEYDK